MENAHERLRDYCKRMREIGCDDGQYVLVKLKDAEDICNEYEKGETDYGKERAEAETESDPEGNRTGE